MSISLRPVHVTVASLKQSVPKPNPVEHWNAMSDKMIDFMLEKANSRKAKKDIRTRQHLMERSYARGTRYGYKRARWRRLWRVQIQEYLTSSIQNIMILVRHIKEPAPARGMVQAKPGQSRAYLRLQQLFFDFKEVITNSISYFFKFRCSEAQNLAENLWPNLKFRVWATARQIVNKINFKCKNKDLS